MPDLLLEIFSEEIPARMQKRAAEELRKAILKNLQKSGISFEKAAQYAGPRRLTVHVCGLSGRSPDRHEEVKGPLVQAGQKAREGFLEKLGLSPSHETFLHRGSQGKGDSHAVRIFKPGQEVGAILPKIIQDVLRSFVWPKSMRWGENSVEPGSFKWIRPLRSVLCLLCEDDGSSRTVDFGIADIASGKETFGHRFHAPEKIVVQNFQDYEEKLFAAKVISCPQKRCALILEGARKLAGQAGVVLVEDQGLVEEVAGLCEWPVVLLGKFDPGFLSLPDDLITCTIRAHQKCFVTTFPKNEEEQAGNLSNHFIMVANIEGKDQGREIRQGNERVVGARLFDALYFWNVDQKDLADMHLFVQSAQKLGLDLSRPLDQRMACLSHMKVIFHARLGTQGERVLRMRDLARDIAEMTGADKSLVERASILAKADLHTMVVTEFPFLQGSAGRQYALAQGEEPCVANALEEHYKPRSAADSPARNPVSVCVALADKLDMLAGFRMAGEWPTGSRDPYGVRRAALGIVRIILENRLRLPLGPLIMAQRERIAMTLPERGLDNTLEPEPEDQLQLAVLSFLHERLKVWLQDQGISQEISNAIIDDNSDDLLRLSDQAHALGRFFDTQQGKDLLAIMKRIFSILRDEEKKSGHSISSVNEDLFYQDEEKELFFSLNEVECSLKDLIGQEKFYDGAQSLCRLIGPVSRFFDNVLVNAKESHVKENRFALLIRIRNATARVGDLSRLTR